MAAATDFPTPFGGLDLSFLDPPAPKDLAAPPADAEFTVSGLVSKMLLRPSCALSKYTPPEQLAKCQRPGPYDKVIVDYTGWTSPSGKMFGSSRNEKRALRIDEIVQGWAEGLQLMSPGESRRFWIPAKLAYGDSPALGNPVGPLVIDVELYSIEKGDKPAQAPEDVAAAPADAVTTQTGLAYKVLKKGTGSKSPTLETKITVKYSGWQTNGQLLMSSERGAPSSFALKEVPIKPLAEGLQMMVEGESRRFWIPPAAEGAKSLVFDMELQRIE